MSKKSRFSRLFYKQHGKRAQGLLKSATRHFYHIHWSLSTQFSLKTSLLLTCQMLGLLVTTLTTDEMYPVLNRDNLTIQFKFHYLRNTKYFVIILRHFWNLEKILNILAKKDDAHRFCNFEVPHSENVVRKISKRSHFREPFNKQHSKWSEVPLKSASQRLYHIYWSLPSQSSSKASLLLTWKILGLLVNTLAAEEKYPVLNRDNLTKPILMQLSAKQKTFSEFFVAFSKSIWNCEHIETKNDPYRFCISEITHCENMVRSMSKKSRLKGPFDKQHGKHVEPILKVAWHYLYHIHWSLPSQFSWKKYVFLTCEILGLHVNILVTD